MRVVVILVLIEGIDANMRNVAAPAANAPAGALNGCASQMRTPTLITHLDGQLRVILQHFTNLLKYLGSIISICKVYLIPVNKPTRRTSDITSTVGAATS